MQCLGFAVQLGQHYDKMRAHGVEVLIIGGGPLGRAQAMAQNSRLPFPILADPDRSVYERYRLGKKLLMIQQSGTILIDRQGVIRHIKRFTNPQAWIRTGEITDVLSAVERLGKEH